VPVSSKQDSADAARILVVNDNEPFRRFVISTLHEQPNLQVIGEEEDGIEAVQRAEARNPT
jgi:chemotaxis response regulator CheB